ncbi:hypothetical protein BDZ89DRAFT_1082706 [Hymenopellis radicata]|nr:hypothetical protein BDZ89DRAFT_1082706 [Hymenopellis radicata]
MAAPSPGANTWSPRSSESSGWGSARFQRSATPPPVKDLRSEREKCFDFHAPTLEDSHAPIPSHPLQFQDRHIPESLTLKHIRFLSVRLCFGVLGHRDMVEVNAQSIAVLRGDSISRSGERIASGLLLMPTRPDGRDEVPTFGLLDEKYASQIPSLEVYDLPPEMDDMDDTFALSMSAMFFCPEALSIMEDMDRLATVNTFPWRLDSRCSKVPPPSFRPPDAPSSLWILPKTGNVRRSCRLMMNLRDVPRHNPAAGRVSVIDYPDVTGGKYKPVCEDYVQKAWIDAVKNDISVIVFDCGHFIRVGIRHRQTQTLFISDLIDIRTCTAPSYGRLWVAVHVAAVYDAIQRLPQLESIVGLKRKAAADTELQASKKPKLNRKNTSDITLATQNRIASLPTVALFLQFGKLDSPSPLLVFPPGTVPDSTYEPKNYLRVVLEKRLGSGAIGDVYRAIIQPDGSSGTKNYCPFVMKLATTPPRVRRLRHEYRVYEHLSAAGVAGIPTVFGFRQTANASVCVLMLSNVGRPLGERMDADRKVKLSAKQGKTLRTILEGIHGAGILHRDIRSWNILIDESGQLYIADFDREKKCLNSFISGKYVDEDAVIGLDDIPHSY